MPTGCMGKDGPELSAALASAEKHLFRRLGKNIEISKTRGLIKRETIARFWIELKIGMSDPVRSSFCTSRKNHLCGGVSPRRHTLFAQKDKPFC